MEAATVALATAKLVIEIDNTPSMLSKSDRKQDRKIGVVTCTHQHAAFSINRLSFCTFPMRIVISGI